MQLYSGFELIIFFSWDRVLQTSERGLVLLSVTESDRGRYECYFGPSLVASYNLDIDIHRLVDATLY